VADLSAPGRRPVKPQPKVRAVTSKVKLDTAPGKKFRIVIPERVMTAALKQAKQQEKRGSVGEFQLRRRSLFAGLALSAAMCSLVLVRRKSTSTKWLVGLAFVGATYAGSQWVYADLGAKPLGPINPPETYEIEIVVSRKARIVELLMPTDEAEQGFGNGSATFGSPPPKSPAPRR
jgi:hypothetical protein